VADIFRAKSGDTPNLVHVHPDEKVESAIAILREYGVSQMPVLRAEPPVMAAEVAGTIDERQLLDRIVTGAASLSDPIEPHMSPPLPLIGGGEPISSLLAELEKADAVMVVVEGTPRGVLSRQDVLGFLAAR
jgi:cystathionine beta-synthase